MTHMYFFFFVGIIVTNALNLPRSTKYSPLLATKTTGGYQKGPLPLRQLLVNPPLPQLPQNVPLRCNLGGITLRGKKEALAFVGEVGGVSDNGENHQGFLLKPQDVGYARASRHFFSCTDNRADYAVLGAPAGDIGELILAISAAEAVAGLKFSFKQMEAYIDSLFAMLRFKPHFYMHTDDKALRSWSATGVDVLSPISMHEINVALDAATLPENIGCHTLREMITNPEKFKTRKLIVETAIRTLLKHFYTKPSKVLFVVLKGDYRNGTLANVYSPDECYDVTPLVQPDRDGKRVHVYHKAHVKYQRQIFSQMFGGIGVDAKPAALYAKMNEIADGYDMGGDQVDARFESWFNVDPFN